jgi:hypothetical protein
MDKTIKKNEGNKMANPCSKEKEIDSLFSSQNETQRSLIKIETLLDSLIKYQLSEQKMATEKANTDIANLGSRLTKVENLGMRILAWASVGGVIGGLVANLVMKKL